MITSIECPHFYFFNVVSPFPAAVSNDMMWETIVTRVTLLMVLDNCAPSHDQQLHDLKHLNHLLPRSLAILIYPPDFSVHQSHLTEVYPKVVV